SADESDTLMKTRTRRGHDRQNKVFDCYPGWARCVLFCPRLHERSTLPVRPASRFLVCFRWPFHAAFPGNSGRTFFYRCFVRCVPRCPRLHERSTLPVCPASIHATLPGNSRRTFFYPCCVACVPLCPRHDERSWQAQSSESGTWPWLTLCDCNTTYFDRTHFGDMRLDGQGWHLRS